MTKQIVHTRHSKLGTPFRAGSRIQQKDDIEEINVLNILKTESEEPKEEDIKAVMEETGEDRKTAIEKLKEMGNDIAQAIGELLKEDEIKETDETLEEIPEIEDN